MRGPGLVHVVGLGEGGADTLGAEARAAVEAATFLAGSPRHLAFFSDHRAERFVIQGNLAELLERLRSGRTGGHPVVLASGDPLLYGIGSYLARHLGRQAVRILPAVSGVQLAFARLGEPWHDARILSAHGRDLLPVVREALAAAKVAILTDPVNTPARVAAALAGAGMEGDCRAFVGENLGGPGERLYEGTLQEAAGWHEAGPRSVLVLLRDPARVRGRRLHFGCSEELFAHQDGLITKAEARAVILARLALREGAVVWDVGAGSGAVAIEAAGLIGWGRVFAVERDPRQLVHLRANAARSGYLHLVVVEGEAPTALAGLPAPEAVFVGGHGGRLGEILQVVSTRLAPGGRVVLAAATLESVGAGTQALAAAGLAWEMVQLWAARGRALPGGGTRLEASNPVFVITAWREGEP